ncbi:MAG: tripartite tricarboxylate transporter substrate binding protein [Xanthobacteraceae bacterium]|nr:tripartite tricarboxylate transporter substrate binding protein [Xanthobacteraceae bacterium]
MKNIARLMTALMLFVLAGTTAQAQDAYPSRPVKIMIAFPVGGLLDTVTRIVGEKLSGLLGQQFVVEARPGAGGTLATAAVAKADPDGYTLMMINDNHALNPSVFRNIPYDSVKDFAPIGFVGYTPLILVANAALPMRSAKDLVEAAKQKPGTITYGSVGVGSASHLAGVMLESAAGIQWQHVPYRGGAPALNDLIAGHVNTMFMSPVVSLPHLQTGKLTGLALAAPTRLEVLPNLTTMAEAGYPVDASYWFGLVAPAGTPPAVLAKLEQALADVLAMPDVRKRLTDMGAIVQPLNGKQFGDYIGAEIVKWGDLVKKAGVKPE